MQSVDLYPLADLYTILTGRGRKQGPYEDHEASEDTLDLCLFA